MALGIITSNEARSIIDNCQAKIDDISSRFRPTSINLSDKKVEEISQTFSELDECENLLINLRKKTNGSNRIATAKIDKLLDDIDRIRGGLNETLDSITDWYVASDEHEDEEFAYVSAVLISGMWIFFALIHLFLRLVKSKKEQ
jgi:hypothetical protein